MLEERVEVWKEQYIQQGRGLGRKEGRREGRKEGRKEGLEKGLKKAVRKDNDMAWDRRSVTFWKPVSGLFRFPSRKPFPA